MVDQMVHYPAVVRLLRAGPLGATLDDFVRDLEARGHAERTIRDYVREAGHLARWMESEGHTASPLSASTVLEFLHVAGATGRGAGRSDTGRPHARPALAPSALGKSDPLPLTRSGPRDDHDRDGDR